MFFRQILHDNLGCASYLIGDGGEAPPRDHVDHPRCPWCRHVETGATGLEPATSGVTGRRSNQLNFAPVVAEV